MPLRAKVATSVSRTAAALSRAAGRGDGSVIGGWIGLKIDPDLLAHLATGRAIALVSGTNGKTTTTRLTTAAVGVLGPVATNSFGANMPTGHTSALAKAGDTPYAVLEVDEHYLPQVLDATNPRVVALLNLSRDQLDRAKEVAMMAAAVARPRSCSTRTSASSPTPTTRWWSGRSPRPSARERPPLVTWFSAGQRWHDDSWVCPECGSSIERSGEQWWCTGCPLRRPEPHWTVEDDGVVDPTGAWHKISLQLPGRVNLGNAATALAVAAAVRRPPGRRGLPARQVTSVAGRYAQVVRDGRNIRLLLAKNPASWLEAFDMADDAPTLLSINARDPDGAGHLLALRRRLLPAARPAGADHRRPGVRPGGAAGGQRACRSSTYGASPRP